MTYEWAQATARFSPVADSDDGTVEPLAPANYDGKRYGIALEDGSAEVVVYGTPAELVEFGERFAAYARKMSARLSGGST